MSAAEDQFDVDQVLAGDVDAFARIVRRWQGPLVNLAYRFCRDQARAEDLAQEAFLRAYRNLSQWRRDAAFSTWLFALATNLYRTELRRIPPLQSLDEAAEPSVPSRLDESLNDAQRRRTVREAVWSLPTLYRDVITLFYFHERDLRAAALSLGLPEGTVKARLARGRDLLRQKLSRKETR